MLLEKGLVQFLNGHLRCDHGLVLCDGQHENSTNQSAPSLVKHDVLHYSTNVGRRSDTLKRFNVRISIRIRCIIV